MNLLHLIWIVPLCLYGLNGVYLGFRWWQHDRADDLPLVLTVVLAAFFWLFLLDPRDKEYYTIMNTYEKTLNKERKRMARELAAEKAKVELLEASASHRQAMADLADRRRRIEDRETEKVLQ